MSIATYGELKTAIAAYLHRDNLTDFIPDFVQYAETVISNDPDPTDPEELPGIRARNQGKRVTALMSTAYIDMPADFLSTRDMQLNTDPVQYLDYLSPKVMTAKYPSGTVGKPRFYTIHGDEFQFGPAPDSEYTLEISYNAKYTAFSDDGDTNWLLTNHPFAYLYAACIAGAAHTDDDPAKWAALYKSIASGINKTESGGQYGSNLVSRPVTATP